MAPGRSLTNLAGAPPRPLSSLDDFREDVGLAEDLDLLAVHLDLGPRVLAEEDLVPLHDADGRALARVEHAARADGEHLAPLRLLLGGVGQHDPAGGLFLGLDLLDHDAIFK